MSVISMYIHTYDLPVQYLINTSTVYMYHSDRDRYVCMYVDNFVYRGYDHWMDGQTTPFVKNCKAFIT